MTAVMTAVVAVRGGLGVFANSWLQRRQAACTRRLRKVVAEIGEELRLSAPRARGLSLQSVRDFLRDLFELSGILLQQLAQLTHQLARLGDRTLACRRRAAD